MINLLGLFLCRLVYGDSSGPVFSASEVDLVIRSGCVDPHFLDFRGLYVRVS